jgi:ABC-type Fe3+/spermidine/putrescine transport system ATPase subunit
VDDVSFTCQPGRIYGLLGANGAGKTTTLRLLATLLKPTSGDATVAGHDHAPSRRRSAPCGFLAASTALYGRLTAREMIAYFGRLNGMDDAGSSRPASKLLADELGDARVSRPPLRQVLHRHEAEDLDRPDPDPRSGGDDLRRAHARARCHDRARHREASSATAATVARRSSTRPTS